MPTAKHLAAIFLCAWLPAAAAASDASLEEIVALARGGAPGLALRLLDEYQAIPDLETPLWTAAERERVHILGAQGDWTALSARLAELRDGLPRPFLDWAAERRAEALLHLDDHAGARRVLMDLIWRAQAPDDATLRGWRMLVIRSYLGAGDSAAALTALQRYAQDYGHTDAASRALHGEVLLAAGRPGDALEILDDTDDPLRWLAALESGFEPAGAVFERAVKGGSRHETPAARRYGAWRVAAEAARRMQNHGAVVAALERGLAVTVRDADVPEPLQIAPAALWDAYRDWGHLLGNAEHLLVGVDGQWLEAADAQSAREPAQARALYATLAQVALDPAAADTAHARFAELLRREQGGDRLLAALYLRGGLFTDPERIPVPVRYMLVDELLRAGELAVVSQLIADLAAPPEGGDALDWNLRRARVLVLAGRRGEGAQVLGQLLSTHDDYDVDRLLQVLFDLQAAGAHAQALPLFARVYAREDLDRQARREILYWKADSWRALGAHEDAARLFLRSATLGDPYAMDQWAQTARYQAAESLTRAGLRDDATVLLNTLLHATDDPGRRAMLQHQLDQLARGR